ncbi:MAG: acyl carrier protein [Candidatus Marinimicrobia bacterium]|nr:acyl carrier protein [Candidatus Neomarinimicrobiota bacterium]
MTISDIDEKIVNVISKIVNMPVTEVLKNFESGKYIFWDSITHLNLIFALEEELGVSFEEEDIVKMNDYNEIKAVISSKLA